MNFMPDLTGFEGLTLVETASKLYKEPIIFIPFAGILLFMFLYFIIVGIFTKSARRRMIGQDNFWILMAGFLLAVALFILTIYFPFYWVFVGG